MSRRAVRAGPTRVVFDVAERCTPGGAVTCEPGQLRKETANHWPDVPFDRNCNAGSTCRHLFSPTFWSRKRLASVTTQTRQPSGDYLNADTWTLRHHLIATGDGMPAQLWLAGVTRTGEAGGTASLPEVKFHGVQLANRVDGFEGLAPMVKWRVAAIVSEAVAGTASTSTRRGAGPPPPP